MADPGPADRIAEAWAAARTDAGALRTLQARAMAIGWATVDIDRATTELTIALGLRGDEPFRVASRSEALGGAVRIAAGVLPGGGSLAVLEPDTEGRLAGSLARLGEGPVAVWLAVSTTETRPEALRRAGLQISSERAGPFGAERLVLGRSGDPPGRHRFLVVRPPGTIRP